MSKSTLYRVCVLAVHFLLPSWLRADQCQVLEPAAAQKAASFLKVGVPFLKFCEPCGEVDPQPAVVETVRVAGWQADSKLSVLLVNGEELDAAYVFVREGRTWRNLAALAGCPASDVSDTLDFELPIERKAKVSAKPPAELLVVDVTDRSYDGTSFGRSFKAFKPVAVLAAPEEGAERVAELPVGSEVALMTMLARVTPVRVKVVFAQGLFRPGDVFWVLDQLGELYARVYFDGKVHELNLEGIDFFGEEFGKGCRKPNPSCWGELEGAPEEKFWAKVRLRDGREGWVQNPAESFEGVYEGH